MVNSSIGTKEKILVVASDLFGKKGFDGVSIRDIAKNADVNIASINYHFNNKKMLFQEVFVSSHTWLEHEVSKLSLIENITLKELSWLTLKLFIENEAMTLNTFRIFLSDQLDMPNDFHEKHCADGPPGGEHFQRVLSDEVGKSVPLDKRQWAVRMIFSNISHIGLVTSTTYMKNENNKMPWMSQDQLRQDTYELVESIINLLKLKYIK